MTATRLTAWTLLAAAGFALLPAPAAGQDPPLPSKPPVDLINKALESRGIAKEDLAKTQEQLAAFARYFADTVAHPLVHRAPQDASLKIDPAGNRYDSTGRVIPTTDSLIRELEARYLPEPTPTSRVTADRADYIRESGAAFDAALRGVVETHPDRVVRVNAARLYAAVSRTGAAAYWPTVTAWLTEANTPTEIKHYALQAAANLLAAYDLFDYRSRRHAVSKEPRADANKEIGALVAAVERCVLDPNALVALPGGRVDKDTPADTLAVIGFVRRQATKALAQVRFVTLPGPDGKPLYPAHTLARVCLSDPALVPAPSPGECGEAVIGLCNMAPMVEGKGGAFVPFKGYRHDAAAEAVAAGLVTFASPRAANPLDRSLPWRSYSIRISEAMKNWPPLFDPAYDPTAKPPAQLTVQPQAPVLEVIKRAQNAILIPIDKVGADGKPDLGARVDIEGMKAFLKQVRATPGRTGLLVDGAPETALPGAAPAADPKKK